MEKKITRSRNGCFTCKRRRRKCDETKPFCKNCTESGRVCEGYGVRLVFDVDDSRKSSTNFNLKGEKKHGFRGRPKINNLENTLIIHNPIHISHDHNESQKNSNGKKDGEVKRIKNEDESENGNGNENENENGNENGNENKDIDIKPKIEVLSSKLYPYNHHSSNNHSYLKSVTKPMHKSSSSSSSSFLKNIKSSVSNSKSTDNVPPSPNLESLLNPSNIDSTPSNSPNILISRESSTNTILSNITSLNKVTGINNNNNKTNSNANTNSASSATDRDFELDFNDPQQFEHAFFSGLDYILDNYDTELLNSVDFSFMPNIETSNSTSNHNNNNNNNNNNNLNVNHINNTNNLNISLTPNYHHLNIPPTINHNHSLKNIQRYSDMNRSNVQNNSNIEHNQQFNNELELDSSNLGPQLKKKEESLILKHFFEKVIYLLDAHPHNPWPQLMMKFGSMDLAKSCFLSLSSMHLYVNNGGDEFYKKGLLHINNTMEYLIKYVKTGGIANSKSKSDSSSSDNENENENENNENNKLENSVTNDLDLNVPKIISKIKSESNKKKGTNFMVILLLLYVHLLFAVLESGRSALARMFLKLSSSIASDPIFNRKMKKIQQSQSLLCVLSWFDTVSALVSPDCRIPYCDPKWFGESSDIISTDKMNGCPVGMFRVLYDLCLYRRKVMLLFQQQECQLKDIKLSFKLLMDLRDRCLHYRDHVLFILPHGSTFTYIDRLKCAQLWSLSAILVTIQLELHYFAKLNKLIEQNRDIISSSEFPDAVPMVHIYSEKATAIVTEFLSVYKTIPSSSPIITQMVWPIFYVAICSSTEESRKESWDALKTLYETVKMGTIKSNMDIVTRVWDEGCSLESILNGEGWFEAGIDLLPC